MWREARARDEADLTDKGPSIGEAVPLPSTAKLPGEENEDEDSSERSEAEGDASEDDDSDEGENDDAGVGNSDGNEEAIFELPPLSSELFQHGGSYLYQPGGDRLGWPLAGTSYYDFLRLPANHCAPQPLTAYAEFLGADPVVQYPACRNGYSLDPRFVAAGNYSVFGSAFEQNDSRHDLIGHQLVLDFDLRLTGTERFHVQWRPVGERMSGGSFYQFDDPRGYVDNSTVEPDRYWFEGELHSLVGPYCDPLAMKDTNFLVGKFPFALHNNLLMNDEILGGVISRNNIHLGKLSNLNVQGFAGLNDVDTYAGIESQVLGIHATVDHRKRLYEMTYAWLNSQRDRDTHFLGISGTRFFGPLSLAGRALFKLGDEGGTGDAQLFVLESNFTRAFHHNRLGVEKGVFFSNAFFASESWNSLGGGNFNRLRTGFEVTPLTRLSTTPNTQDTVGATCGVQLFRHHEDESLIPEFAWEQPDGDPVFGVGLRYLRKTGPQTYLEVLGVINRGRETQHDREGVFVAHTIVF